MRNGSFCVAGIDSLRLRAYPLSIKLLVFCISRGLSKYEILKKSRSLQRQLKQEKLHMKGCLPMSKPETLLRES